MIILFHTRRIIQSFRNRFIHASERSRLAFKNILLSLILKFSSVLASLIIVPMTINYIDSSQYGIWLTISSIVAWANFFDLGLANGFKNKFAQAKALGDFKLAHQYVSTTYAVLIVIMSTVLGVILSLNFFIDWPAILNVNENYKEILSKTFAILSTFFCMNMVVNILAKLFEADQKPALASLISCIGQLLSLLSIFLLTTYTKGSLLNLALYYSSVPVLTFLCASIITFNFTKYKRFRPSLTQIKVKLVKDIIGLGVKFFLIYLCLLVVFHLMNVVLSREVGPIAVTKYNIANKYFSIIYMVSAIIVSPMWAAFTDAYSKNDLNWMKSTINKLEKWFLMSGILCIFALILSPFFYKIWIRNEVEVPITLSITVMLFIIAQIGSNIFTTLICGLGHMRIQTVLYVISALCAFPLMSLLTKYCGIYGITIIPTLVCIFQTVLCRKQLWKILNKQASGIWLK